MARKKFKVKKIGGSAGAFLKLKRQKGRKKFFKTATGGFTYTSYKNAGSALMSFPR